MPRLFLEISYNGTSFHGWQKQPNANTVQVELEKALKTILQKEVDTVGCGRTDAGVHATQFFAHADVPAVPAHSGKFLRGLNALLPDAIAAKTMVEVEPEAHARFDASARSYRYEIHTSKDPFLTDRSYLYHEKLDLQKMKQGLSFPTR